MSERTYQRTWSRAWLRPDGEGWTYKLGDEQRTFKGVAPTYTAAYENALREEQAYLSAERVKSAAVDLAADMTVAREIEAGLTRVEGMVGK